MFWLISGQTLGDRRRSDIVIAVIIELVQRHAIEILSQPHHLYTLCTLCTLVSRKQQQR